MNDLHQQDLVAWNGSPLALKSSLSAISTLPRSDFEKGNSDKVAFGSWRSDTEVNVDIKNSIAVISMQGLMRPTSPWWSMSAGLESIISEILSLKDNGRVVATVIKNTTPGGVPFRISDFNNAVALHKKEKPIYLFGQDLLLSAGMWASEQFTKIFCDPDCDVGCFGVYMVVTNAEKALEDRGISRVLVNDNPEGVKGEWDLPGLSEAYLDSLQEEVLALSKSFQISVRKGRGFSKAKTAKLFNGKSWRGEEARKRGLVDEVLHWHEFLATLSADPIAFDLKLGDGDPMEEEKIDEENLEDKMSRANLEETVPVSFVERILTAIGATGKGVEPTNSPAPAILVKPLKAAVNMDQGLAYLKMAAKMQVSTRIDLLLSQQELTPGVKATVGLSNMLCALQTLSIMQDKTETLKGSSECSAMYELMATNDNLESKLACAMEVFPIVDPLGTIFQALGASPKFVGTHPSATNFIFNAEVSGAPKGEGQDQNRPPEPIDPENWEQLSVSSQSIAISASNGIVKDQETYTKWRNTSRKGGK